MQDWKAYRKGYVRICICADSPERFLNLCAYHKIRVWNLMQKGNKLEMNLSVKDFYGLKKRCQKTPTRIKITGKYGLPFFFYRNKKRKAFFIGIFIGFFLLAVLSRHIWNIHVEGNIHNSTQSILRYLEQLDIEHGVLKKELDCGAIAEKLRGEFPNITWVSARISGSRLILEIRENDNIYQGKDKKEGRACDLVALRSGRIVSMITRRGTPVKKAGDICTKGEVLVRGTLDIQNDSKELVRQEYTQADADVFIEYELEYYQEFPMKYRKPVYTGEKKKGYVLQIGDYCLDTKRKASWKEFDTITSLKQVRLTENFQLPVFYGTSTDYAYQTEIFTYTPEEARERAKKRLNLVLESFRQKGVQISANHVKIGIQNGICRAKGSISVIEEAGEEVPIQIPEQPTERNTDLNE